MLHTPVFQVQLIFKTPYSDRPSPDVWSWVAWFALNPRDFQMVHDLYHDLYHPFWLIPENRKNLYHPLWLIQVIPMGKSQKTPMRLKYFFPSLRVFLADFLP